MLPVNYFHAFISLHECKVRLDSYADQVDVSYFGICTAGTIIPTLCQALEENVTLVTDCLTSSSLIAWRHESIHIHRCAIQDTPRQKNAALVPPAGSGRY